MMPLLRFACAGPHNNLASNINLGRGTRAFHSGGNTVRGTHAGVWCGWLLRVVGIAVVW